MNASSVLPYTVGLIEQVPLVIRDENETPSGYIPDLLQEIGRILQANFTYVWTNKYGSVTQEGVWDGLVRMVMDREVDVGAAGLTITYVREQVIDFSKPFMNTGIVAAMAKPQRKDTKPDYFLFLRPFNASVWALILACFIVFGICFFLYNKYHPKEGKSISGDTSNTSKSRPGLDLCGSYCFTARMAFFQGAEFNPRSTTGRLLTITWTIFSTITLILYATEMANFLSNRPSNTVAPRLRSVKDIALTNDVIPGFIAGGSTMGFFHSSRVNINQKIFDRAQTARSYREGLMRVRQDAKYAFFMESHALEYELQKAPCDLYQVGDILNSVGLGFAFPNRSPMRQQFNLALLKLQESQVLQQLYDKYWFTSSQCGEDSDTVSPGTVGPTGLVRPLTVEEYSGVILLLAVGLLLSVVMAGIEAFTQRRNRPTRDV